MIEIEDVPTLDLKNVISILISSDFLQMQELVNECISYIVSNMHDVVRLPIDMSCLNQELIKQISLKTPIRKLDSLVDKRDKLTSKIFEKKLENLFFQVMNDPLYSDISHQSLFQDQINEDMMM